MRGAFTLADRLTAKERLESPGPPRSELFKQRQSKHSKYNFCMSRTAGLRKDMHREPDHIVIAAITTPDRRVVPDVNCRVYLPPTMMEQPYLEFDLSESQSAALIVPEFSMEGRGELAGRMVSIRSEIVITQGWSKESRGSQFIKCTMPGEPWDLEVSKRATESADSVIQKGTFSLSPNRFLTPRLMELFSYTGAIEMKTAHELAFRLPSGLVHFRRHYRHEKKQSAVLRTSELVAELNEEIERGTLDRLIQELDDFLLLTSLATRHTCVCRGWTVGTENCETTFYRNRLAVPRAREIGRQETLIDDPVFKEFVEHAFVSFRQNPGREALRQAMYLVVSSQEATIEASFIKCFAALETLLTLYRDGAGLSTILDSDSWATFENDFKSFIKGHVLFRDNATRRGLIYEKRGELNRISFGTAYKKCIESLSLHGFHDDDLWPIVGSGRGLSLVEIRNRLLHGVVLTPAQEEALFKALIHLRWCVERMILAFLEWPLEQSLVGRFLRHMATYNSWKADQESLSSTGAGF